MTTTTLFVSFFGVTLVLLGIVIWTGKLAKRRWHLTFVALTVASLGTTIYFAEQLGKLYDLESAGAITPVHLFFAKVATAAFLLPAISGILTIRRAERVVWHRAAAYTAVVLTVIAACTGVAMVWLSNPL